MNTQNANPIISISTDRCFKKLFGFNLEHLHL